MFRHVGRGDRWAAQIVADRVDHYLDPRTVESGKPPADPDEAIVWLHGGAQRLIDAVEHVGAETPVWTFLGSRPAYWWVRRRLHEATVHRADAALALRLDYTLTPELAADAISEWLERVAAQAGRDDDRCRWKTAKPFICTPVIPVSALPVNGPSAPTETASRGHTVTTRARLRCAAAPSTCCWQSCGEFRSPTPISRYWATPRYGSTGSTTRLSRRGAHGTFHTMTTSEIATVLAWHDALNASDIDTLLALSSDDIEVGDAHGAGQGHAALRDWAAARPRRPKWAEYTFMTASWSSNRRSATQTIPVPTPLSRQRFVSSTTTSPRCFATTTSRPR